MKREKKKQRDVLFWSQWTAMRKELLSGRAVCRICGTGLQAAGAVLMAFEDDASLVCANRSACAARKRALDHA